MVSRHLQRQVLLLAATLILLNGRDMASSCTFQKGQCQQNLENAELTSKLVSLDSSISQMIYSLLAVYTGCLVLRNFSSLSHLKLSIVHHFRTLPSLQAFGLLLPSVLRQNCHTTSEHWRKECLNQGVPMAAFKPPNFQFLELAFLEDYGHYSDTTVPCTTFRRTLISGI